MLRVIVVSDPYIVESQYSKETVEMFNVTFTESRSSGGDASITALEKITGLSGLGLVNDRVVTKAIPFEHADSFKEDATFDGFINRSWVEHNPYPKAVKDDGTPKAETKAKVCPDGQTRMLFARTVIGETMLEDTYEYSDETEVVDPQTAELPAANTVKRTVRQRA